MKLLPIAGNCPFPTFVAFDSLSRCFLPMLTLALAGEGWADGCILHHFANCLATQETPILQKTQFTLVKCLALNLHN